MDVTIATRREKGFDAALAIVNTDTGRIAMEAVEADIDAIIDAADVRLQARMATAESLEQHVTLTFLIGSIIAACALIAGAFLLARAYRRAALSEGVLQATLDSVREGVAAFDADRRLLAWNQIFSRMLKLPRGTLRRGEPLPAGMTNEVDHFSEYLETSIPRSSELAARRSWNARRPADDLSRFFIVRTRTAAPSPPSSTAAASRGGAAPGTKARGARPNDRRGRA